MTIAQKDKAQSYFSFLIGKKKCACGLHNYNGLFFSRIHCRLRCRLLCHLAACSVYMLLQTHLVVAHLPIHAAGSVHSAPSIITGKGCARHAAVLLLSGFAAGWTVCEGQQQTLPLISTEIKQPVAKGASS